MVETDLLCMFLYPCQRKIQQKINKQLFLRGMVTMIFFIKVFLMGYRNSKRQMLSYRQYPSNRNFPYNGLDASRLQTQ